MKTKWFRGLMLCVLAVVLSSALVYAQQGRRPGMQFDPNKMTGGEIKNIDAQAMTFEVERVNRQSGETSKDTIYCTDKTSYMKDGNEAKFADFKVGDRIRANGERKDGKFMADHVMSGGRPRSSSE
jgi:Cu/Ag efflux protein CusF